jgi:predicted metal-binding membrane protein
MKKDLIVTLLVPNITRSILWAAFFIAIIVAWWMMYAMASQMGLNWYGASVRETGMGAMISMDSMRVLFPMWAIMMIAMMGPTFVVTMRTYEDLIVSADGTRGGIIGLITGYFLAWIGFAGVIAAIQAMMMAWGWLDIMGASTLLWPSALLLIVVGLFQFTWVKQVCHGVCHTPMNYFLGHWRTGFIGGTHMGLSLGIYCVVCCWGFMALGFVGGTMNLLWMGLATVLMTLEKLPQVARYIVKPLGVSLIVSGILVGGHALNII